MNYSKIKNFGNDQRVEHKIDTFLDENFYSTLSTTIPFSRTTELSDQYAGIDIRLGNSLIDNKSKNTSTPNTIRNYYCSLELYHTQRDGTYKKGWFLNPNQKTTHYFFQYRFEDQDQDISSVIIVSFKKQEMIDYLDKYVGMNDIISLAESMKDAMKGTDDKILRTSNGIKIGKLTKTYENATVLTFNLTDLSRLPSSHVLEIIRGKQIKKLTFNELKCRFTN